MRAEAAAKSKAEKEMAETLRQQQNSEMRAKIATSGPAIDAALDDDVNAARDRKKVRHPACPCLLPKLRPPLRPSTGGFRGSSSGGGGGAQSQAGGAQATQADRQPNRPFTHVGISRHPLAPPV